VRNNLNSILTLITGRK